VIREVLGDQSWLNIDMWCQRRSEYAGVRMEMIRGYRSKDRNDPGTKPGLSLAECNVERGSQGG
jgi:hypothetical protein